MRNLLEKFQAHNSHLPPAYFELAKKLAPTAVLAKQGKTKIDPSQVQLIVKVRGREILRQTFLLSPVIFLTATTWYQAFVANTQQDDISQSPVGASDRNQFPALLSWVPPSAQGAIFLATGQGIEFYVNWQLGLLPPTATVTIRLSSEVFMRPSTGPSAVRQEIDGEPVHAEESSNSVEQGTLHLPVA